MKKKGSEFVQAGQQILQKAGIRPMAYDLKLKTFDFNTSVTPAKIEMFNFFLRRCKPKLQKGVNIKNRTANKY
jgi:hypothetical protein